MSKPLVTDALWAVVEPRVPPESPKPKGGRPRVPDRAALTGILFVLQSGIPREVLPHEMGCGSGMTCWRRLRDWQEAGVWAGIHRVLLERSAYAGHLDWSRTALDSAPAAPDAMSCPRSSRTGRLAGQDQNSTWPSKDSSD